LVDHEKGVKLSDFGIMKEFGEESLSKTFTGNGIYFSFSTLTHLISGIADTDFPSLQAPLRT